jgi:hypothetical protein
VVSLGGCARRREARYCRPLAPSRIPVVLALDVALPWPVQGPRPTGNQAVYKPRNPPSQSWRTFLDNHVGSLASIDFFTVPTATFRIRYVFFVLAHQSSFHSHK